MEELCKDVGPFNPKDAFFVLWINWLVHFFVLSWCAALLLRRRRWSESWTSSRPLWVPCPGLEPHGATGLGYGPICLPPQVSSIFPFRVTHFGVILFLTRHNVSGPGGLVGQGRKQAGGAILLPVGRPGILEMSFIVSFPIFRTRGRLANGTGDGSSTGATPETHDETRVSSRPPAVRQAIVATALLGSWWGAWMTMQLTMQRGASWETNRWIS